jgi:hypothetical protein
MPSAARSVSTSPDPFVYGSIIRRGSPVVALVIVRSVIARRYVIRRIVSVVPIARGRVIAKIISLMATEPTTTPPFSAFAPLTDGHQQRLCGIRHDQECRCYVA